MIDFKHSAKARNIRDRFYRIGMSLIGSEDVKHLLEQLDQAVEKIERLEDRLRIDGDHPFEEGMDIVDVLNARVELLQGTIANQRLAILATERQVKT